MGLSAVDAEVFINQAGNLFTCGEIVSGTVAVSLKKSKPIKTVEISLRCTVYAVVRLSSDSVLTFRHHIHRDNVCVFPDRGMTVIDKGGYSMSEGRHEYPFEFELPSDASLPQSLPNVSEGTGIFWNIKVKVTRAGAINVRKSENFMYTPLGSQYRFVDPDRRLWIEASRKFWAYNADTPRGFMSRIGRKNQTQCIISCRLTYPEDGLEQGPLPASLGLEIQCSETNMVVLDKVKLRLKARAYMYDDQRRYSSTASSGHLVIAELEPQKPLEKSTSIDDLLASVQIPEKTPGTLEVINIQYKYRLYADLVFSAVHCPSYTKKLTVDTEINVLPPRPGNATEALPSYSQVEEPPPHPDAVSSVVGTVTMPADGKHTFDA